MEKRLGKCYELAGAQMMDMDNRGIEGLRLVHGMIGLPEHHTPHAWVQYVDDDWIIERDGVVFMDGTVTWEPVTEAVYPVDVFMAVFRSRPMEVYTMDEMREIVLEHKHWGPWDGDYWQVNGGKVGSA